MRFFSFFLIATAVHAVAAMLANGSKSRRICAVLLTFLALPLPCFMPADYPGLRALLALVMVMGCLRSIDLLRDNTPRSVLFRLVHLATPIDTRRISRVRASLELRKLGHVFAYALVAAASFWLVSSVAPSLSGLSATLLRWGAGLVLTYAFTDVAYGTVHFSLRAVGLDVYELHRAPALSLSVKEFWGERWNRTVSAWFTEHCLRPLARRKMLRFGVFASFLASAVLHAYLVLVAVGGSMALVMFGYFMLQAAFVFLELHFRANRWNRTFARVWTIVLMTVASPLFVEPGLRSIGL